MANQRPFNPEALTPYAVPWIKPNIGNWAIVWRYTLLVPVEQIVSDGTVRSVATPEDLLNLELMLIGHFGGITTLGQCLGLGMRDPKDPVTSRETNKHASYLVYAPAAPAADQYFQAVRAELQDALVEAMILVERQEVLLL
jgi:hypothetical protein